MNPLKDIIQFEMSALKDNLQNIKKNPERIFIGAGDQVTSKVWGKLLNKDYEPITDQWGGAPPQAYGNAEAKGIDTRAGKGMHMIARVIAASEAGGYGAEQLGIGAGGAAGSSGNGWEQFANIPTPGGGEALNQPDPRAQQKQALIARAQQIRSRIDALRGRPQVEATQEEPVKMADGGQVTKADLVLENLRSYGVL